MMDKADLLYKQRQNVPARSFGKLAICPPVPEIVSRGSLSQDTCGHAGDADGPASIAMDRCFEFAPETPNDSQILECRCARHTRCDGWVRLTLNRPDNLNATVDLFSRIVREPDDPGRSRRLRPGSRNGRRPSGLRYAVRTRVDRSSSAGIRFPWALSSTSIYQERGRPSAPSPAISAPLEFVLEFEGRLLDPNPDRLAPRSFEQDGQHRAI